MYVRLVVRYEDLKRYENGGTIRAVTPNMSHRLSGYHSLEVMVRASDIVGFTEKKSGETHPEYYNVYEISKYALDTFL